MLVSVLHYPLTKLTYKCAHDCSEYSWLKSVNYEGGLQYFLPHQSSSIVSQSTLKRKSIISTHICPLVVVILTQSVVVNYEMRTYQ